MKHKRRKPIGELRAEYRFDYSNAVRVKHDRPLVKEGANVTVQPHFKSGKTKYADERLGDLRVISDFLPRPENHVFRVQKSKSTRELSHGRKSS